MSRRLRGGHDEEEDERDQRRRPVPHAVDQACEVLRYSLEP
jgi:hypothetical protein